MLSLHQHIIPVYLRLDLSEFRALVRGKEVVTHASTANTSSAQGNMGAVKVEAHIILADIGFAHMLAEIDEAMNDTDPRGS